MNNSKYLKRLINAYSTQGPRYTSYPTAVEFTNSFNSDSWKKFLIADAHLSTALYFHLPFCNSLCYFCACNKIIARSREGVAPYLQTLFKELKTYQELLDTKNIEIEQIHWGGGTPNYLLPDEMIELHQRTLEIFPKVENDADISVEIDPRTISSEHLSTLRKLGFNRLSMGVQDFDPFVQETINRIQPYELTRDVCLEARDVGFEGLNIDLIYGLPNQTTKGFSSTLEKILEIKPERIALYGYAHVTWIKKVQKALERSHLPTPEERIDLFLQAYQMLVSAGYLHIGMDHFALPSDELSIAQDSGKLNRNFMGYTTHKGANIFGFGMSAISSLANAFAQNTRDINFYQQAIDGSGFAIERGLVKTKDDQIRADLIERILCYGALDIAEFERNWQIDFFNMFQESVEQLQTFEKDNLIDVSNGFLKLTTTGKLFMRNVAMCFDAYLAKHQKRPVKTFSQTV